MSKKSRVLAWLKANGIIPDDLTMAIGALAISLHDWQLELKRSQKRQRRRQADELDDLDELDEEGL